MIRMELDDSLLIITKSAFCPECELLKCSNNSINIGPKSVCMECQSLREISVNSVAQKLLNKLKFPCIHEYVGCSVKLKLEDLTYHEANCNYMMRQCPLALESCNWEGRFEELEMHCEHSHANSCLEASYGDVITYLSPQADNSISSVIFTCGSAFKCTWYKYNTKFAHLSVAHLGQQYPNNRFRYEVSIMNRGVSVATFKGFCFQPPFKASIRQVPMYILRRNCDKEGFLFSKVQVTKVQYRKKC